ncbi:hypothetical protein ACHAXR_002281, partial [Thalassiosira sp. AJA248-18]
MKQHGPLNISRTSIKDKSGVQAVRSRTEDDTIGSVGAKQIIRGVIDDTLGGNNTLLAGSMKYTSASNTGTNGVEEISLIIEDDHEPYLSRWQRRFASSEARHKKGGYLFFKHIRKAGGTSLRTYFRDVLAYHNITRSVEDWRAMRRVKQTERYQIHYVEHEFLAIDSQCPSIDPRWRESMRIIVLRHPIERHLSEFFFSGPGVKYHPIDKQQLYANQTYTTELAEFMKEWVPKWMRRIGKGDRQGKGVKGQFNMIFGRYYTDNFQLRALAGCSSGDCLKEKEVTEEEMEKINDLHPSSYSYAEPVPRCTNYFGRDKPDQPANLFEQCAKDGHIREECSARGCDGPCFYPSVAWGKVGNNDIARAIHTLKSFDAVLLMEKLDDQDQSDFLSDILGVPRDAEFSLAKRGSVANAGVEKSGKREKNRFYRDLLLKLGLKESLNNMLRMDNKLEIEF